MEKAFRKGVDMSEKRQPNVIIEKLRLLYTKINLKEQLKLEDMHTINEAILEIEMLRKHYAEAIEYHES